MGWMFTHKTPGEKPVDFVRRDLSRIGDDATFEVEDIAMVGQVAYVALRVTPRTEDRLMEHGMDRFYELRSDGSFTTAVIVLTKRDARSYCNFGQKVMDETVMPYYFDCPDRIMARLSPFKETLEADAGARKWRAGVAENRAAKKVVRNKKRMMEDGNIVVFDEPITFQRGYGTFTHFEVSKVGRAVRFYALNGLGGKLFLCRITRYANRKHSIMTRESAFPMKVAA